MKPVILYGVGICLVLLFLVLFLKFFFARGQSVTILYKSTMGYPVQIIRWPYIRRIPNPNEIAEHHQFAQNTLYKVLVSDGNAGHAAYAWRKTGLFWRNIIWFVTALDQIECLKQIKQRIWLIMCAPISKLPSIISTMVLIKLHLGWKWENRLKLLTFCQIGIILI